MTSPTREAALSVLRTRDISRSFSHLWSDALFAREQARERDKAAQRIANNLSTVPTDCAASHVEKTRARYRAELSQCRWDRGVYIRWTVITAWMAFGRACGHAVDDPEVSRNIKVRLPRALTAKGLQSIDWSHGLWKEVNGVRLQRVIYTHGECTTEELFGELQVAENGITVLRRGIIDLYDRVGKDHPGWVDCDKVPHRLGGSSAWGTVVSGGVEDDPGALRIVAVFGDAEWDSRLLRSDEDLWPHVEQLILNINVPITAIRIYKGNSLMEELPIRIRGA